MIVGGFTLDLYCDGEGCKHLYRRLPHDFEPARFCGPSKAVCKKQARCLGWKISEEVGDAFCPDCSKKK